MSNFEFPQKQTLRQAWLQVEYWEEGDPGKYYNGMGTWDLQEKEDDRVRFEWIITDSSRNPIILGTHALRNMP